jgi:hypothetical protein
MKKALLAVVVSLLACAAAARAADEPASGDNSWIDGNYLVWWLQGLRVPPLVTTGTATGSPAIGSGILGQPGTQTVTGDQTVREPWLQGARLDLGFWFDCDHTQAVEISGFGLFQRGRTDFTASGTAGSPVLARPIVDARSGQETVVFISTPGAFSSTDGVSVVNKASLWGVELNMLWVTEHFVQPYCNLITGVRFLELRESLSIAQNSMILPQGVAFFNGFPLGVGNQIGIEDDFTTRNDFIGAQVGARWGFNCGCFSADVIGKVALGAIQEQIDIAGSTTATPPVGPSSTTSGGLLALSTNSGRHTHVEFAVVPEVAANVGLDITSHIRLIAGGSFLFISAVTRPNDGINRVVDRSFLPSSQVFNPSSNGPAEPSFSFSHNTFWATGGNVGVQVSY